MGKGSRPDKAKTLVLVPGAAAGGVATAPPPPPEDELVDTAEASLVEPAGGIAVPEPEPSRRIPEGPPAYPTHLDATWVSDPTTPDEMLANLNHLALQGAVGEPEFQELYLQQLGPLGATPGAAHQQWEALATQQQAEELAARQLAEQMQAAAALAEVRPWNPLDDVAASGAEVEKIRSAFNTAVDEARPVAQAHGRMVASELKDGVVQEMSRRSGLDYKQADAFVAAWAGTSNDHNPLSIAMQVTTAEKFELELTGYVAKIAAQLGTDPGFAKTKSDARRFVDAMYEHTQDFLKARGIEELVLFRGMRGTIGADTAPVNAASGPIPATVHLNPLNSWTANYSTSYGFSDNAGYTLTARVPASKVIGSCFTGLGCLVEQEFVVAGGSGQQVTAVANNKVQYKHAGGKSWSSS